MIRIENMVSEESDESGSSVDNEDVDPVEGPRDEDDGTKEAKGNMAFVEGERMVAGGTDAIWT